MSFEDQPTQQIRRTPPPAPIPGPLNPATRPATSTEANATEVLSLDDLLGPPVADAAPAPAVSPPVATPAPVAQPSAAPSMTRLRGGMTAGREWIGRGDNAVIVATALVALLLLISIALV